VGWGGGALVVTVGAVVVVVGAVVGAVVVVVEGVVVVVGAVVGAEQWSSWWKQELVDGTSSLTCQGIG
jgi:hypothetical protein